MKKNYFLLFTLLIFGQINSQVLNQNANWPNPAWTITGTYNSNPLAFESNPTITSSFAYDDDDAGSASNDDIAAESPVINLTPAFNALEKSIRVNVQYAYNFLGNDVLRFEYWNADTSTWIDWGGNLPENNDLVSDNYCAVPKTLYTTPVMDISLFTPTQLSGFKYRIYWNDNLTGGGWNWGFCFDSPVISSVPLTLPDYANLQFPATAITSVGGTDVTIYAQVYEAGLTDVAPNIIGQAPGIQAWIGYSSTNTNPNTWTNWIPATWNAGHVSNNDEYQIGLGSTLAPGTYYYASRFSLTTGPYVYGGLANFWNATTAISGVLTVNPIPNDNCSGAIPLTAGGVFADYPLNGSVLYSTTSSVVIPICPTFAPAGNSDVWYSVAIPASGSLTIETQASTTNPIGDTVLVAFSGTCTTLAPLTCNDDTTGLYSTITLTGQTPLSVVYVGVWKYGTTAPNATTNGFRISAYDASLSNSTFENNNFIAYPNPVKDILNISFSQNIEKVQVINLLGQEVLTKAMNTNEGQIDMSGLTQGAYLVRVTSNNQVKTIKVIKE